MDSLVNLKTTVSGIELRGIELLLSSLLSTVFRGDAAVVYNEKFHSFKAEQGWICLQVGAGKEFGICFKDLSKELFEFSYFRNLFRIGQWIKYVETSDLLSALDPDFPITLVKPFESKLPPVEYHYSIYEKNDDFNFLGDISLALNFPIEQLSGEVSYSRTSAAFLKKKIETSIVLELAPEADLARLDLGGVIGCKKIGAWLQAPNWLSGVPDWEIEIFTSDWGWNLYVKGAREMKNKKDMEMVELTIALGSVKLTLEDFLSLRPGSEIAFKAQEKLEGMLLSGSTDWATCEVSFEGQQIDLKIKEVADST